MPRIVQFALALPLLTMAAAPAAAQSLDWKAANAAYAEGAARAKSASLADEQMVLCDALWSTWAAAQGDQRLTPDIKQALNTELGEQSFHFALQWSRVTENLPWEDKYNALYEGAEREINGLLNGNAAPRIFVVMGSCRTNL